MLTNLDFLQPGRPWPPPEEQDRLARYDANRKLFNGDHAEVYIRQLRRIERDIGSLADLIGYVVVPNFQRLISLKTADLLCGEPPELSLEDETRTQEMNDRLNAAGFTGLLYQCGLDISRYGDALLTVSRDGTGQGRLSVCQPSTWFPIVSPLDCKRARYHVIAWPEADRERLHVQVHAPGGYSETVYALGRGQIGRALEPTRQFVTGLPGFAVFPMQGLATSDSMYGYDDYSAVDSTISEIMVLIGNISRILDKHAAPSMTGADTLLQETSNGEYMLPAGNYFVRNSAAEPEFKYITWDGQLSAAFTHLKNLLEQLYVISEMGEAILGTGVHQGVTTYKALKLRMTAALSKVRRISSNIAS